MATSELSEECKELLHSLRKENGWIPSSHLYRYNNFWCTAPEIQAILAFYRHFEVKDTDIIVSTIPKSGTTWIKALAFAITKRDQFPPSHENHPLLSSNSHQLVPFFEYNLYGINPVPDISNLPEPRIFGTHMPFDSLPDSMKKSVCKMVYLCRNPLDACLSLWLFVKNMIPPSVSALPMEEACEKFCEGVNAYGPFWTHMLSYWNASKENPNKVLFLKYEDMKGDTKVHVKRLAEFLNCPFTSEEESNGVVESIIELCSFEKMKGLEVNKSGVLMDIYQTKNFFRKGEVGDYVNHFSPSMIEKLFEVTHEKLSGSGLTFDNILLSSREI